MQKQHEIYKGKAKTIYTTDDPTRVIMHYRNDVSAFNAEKLANLAGKGKVNNYFNAFIMEKLHKAGIPTHFEKVLSEQDSLVKSMQMIPIECVVRNQVAGGLAKRLGLQEGMLLDPYVFEFFYKSDKLGDPMINESHIRTFKWASAKEIVVMKELSHKVNDVLKPLFLEVGILLVDYKLEFGRYNDEILLGDEFTPDGCRLWDAKTEEKMDKDRFRRDLGGVVEHYEEVARRLGVTLD